MKGFLYEAASWRHKRQEFQNNPMEFPNRNCRFITHFSGKLNQAFRHLSGWKSRPFAPKKPTFRRARLHTSAPPPLLSYNTTRYHCTSNFEYLRKKNFSCISCEIWATLCKVFWHSYKSLSNAAGSADLCSPGPKGRTACRWTPDVEPPVILWPIIGCRGSILF